MAHPKGLLIERLSKLGVGKPEFRTENTGPAHEPTFRSEVVVAGEIHGTGHGSNKREAERAAAEEALAYLDRNPLALEPLAGDEANENDEYDEAEESGGGFEGPWPMFDDLLAACLEVANRRTDVRLFGPEARVAVRDFALELYKELLEDLGDVVEEDQEEEAEDEEA